MTSNIPLLSVRDLRIDIKTMDGVLKAVRGVDLDIHPGRTLGLVGESGCGKSLTSKAILGINPPNCQASGSIQFNASNGSWDLLALKPGAQEIRAIRGRRISMIFQEPMTAFSPLYTIGNQISEILLLHVTKDKAQARAMAIDILGRVGIASPEKRIDQYPHEFSGGMLQRAMIAMAIVCKPELLIADEPTTALDVTIQAQILQIMQELQKEFGMAIFFITHDMGTIASMCDEVAVMYLGQIVEYAPVRQIFHHPLHPYTRGLLASIPKMGMDPDERLASIKGQVPVPIGLPDTCGFYPRCPLAEEAVCLKAPVPLIEVEPGHFARCFKAVGEEGAADDPA